MSLTTTATGGACPALLPPMRSGSNQNAQNGFADIIMRSWERRAYFTAAAGIACLAAGAVAVFTGVWIGKVALIAIIGLTLLGYSVKRYIAQHNKLESDNSPGDSLSSGISPMEEEVKTFSAPDDILSVAYEGVLTKEQCQELTNERLKELFTSCVSSFQLAGERAQQLLASMSKRATLSQDYSQEMLIAEQSLFTLKNIMQIFTDRHVTQDDSAIKNAEATLKQWHAQQPLGPTALLPSDVEMLNNLSMLPQATSCQWKGKNYLQPQISHFKLMGAIAESQSTGCFRGITTALILDRLFTIEFETPFTMIALCRSDEQQIYLVDHYNQRQANVAHAGGVRKESLDYITRLVKKTSQVDSKLESELASQEAYLQELEKDWPRLIEQLGFASFKRFSSQSLIEKSHIEIQQAVRAEFILLFYKPQN